MALLQRMPGLTELEIAAELFPGKPYQQRVSRECRKLLRAGVVHRLGLGLRAHPFRYYHGSSTEPTPVAFRYSSTSLLLDRIGQVSWSDTKYLELLADRSNDQTGGLKVRRRKA